MLYIPSPLSQTHTKKTKTAPNTASSIHRLLMFVNAANKDVIVGCFIVRMQPGKLPEREIGSLGTTLLASS